MKSYQNIVVKITALVSLCLLIMLTNTAYASEPPVKCPSVGAIIAEKFDWVGPFYEEGWMGFKNSRYDTQDNWDFIYMAVLAKNEQEAREKLTASLSSLHFENGPEETGEKGTWGCLYTGINETFGVAFTPPSIDLLSSLGKFKGARKL